MDLGLDRVKEIIRKSKISIKKEARLANNTGSRLDLSNNAVVNIYDNGKCVVQGKNSEQVEQLLKENDSSLSGVVPSNKVFIVYGHDTQAREQLELILRRWNLDPIILDQLPSEGQTIIEKLESYQQKITIGFAIVLATPDDLGYKRDREGEKAFRARQNVVLELGMMLAHLGRKKVVILLKDQERMERPSDIQGLIYIPFKDDVKDAQIQLAKEMIQQGYKIDVHQLQQ